MLLPHHCLWGLQPQTCSSCSGSSDIWNKATNLKRLSTRKRRDSRAIIHVLADFSNCHTRLHDLLRWKCREKGSAVGHVDLGFHLTSNESRMRSMLGRQASHEKRDLRGVHIVCQSNEGPAECSLQFIGCHEVTLCRHWMGKVVFAHRHCAVHGRPGCKSLDGVNS